MKPTLHARTVIALVVACGAGLAIAQLPSSGVDLGTLTPKTPTQKAADASNATTSQNSAIPGSVGPSGNHAASTLQGGVGGNARTGVGAKTGIGMVGGGLGSNAKSAAPAAIDDTSSPTSTDVQVKMPSGYKK